MLASSQIHRTTAPTGGFLFPHNKTVTSYAKVIIKKKRKGPYVLAMVFSFVKLSAGSKKNCTLVLLATS